MSQKYESQIRECEEKLRQAMLQSDTSKLAKMLSSDLVFTNHIGMRMTKQDDLNAHDSGMLKIFEIVLSDQEIKICGNMAIVFVRAYISGSFAGKKSTNNFRFTRVWIKQEGDYWKIIAGHSSIEELSPLQTASDK